MKKKFNLITFFSLCAIVASAQFTVNGNMNESGYKTTVTKSNANLCFGTAIDITAIKIGKDASNIYIGVVCKMDPTGSNGIAVWLNFSNVTGTSAGTNMTLAGAGHYMASNFAADFEVDYLFALNPGGTATECYVDAMRRVGTPLSAYLDNCGQTGISIAGSRGGTTPNFVFSAPGIEFAFLGTGIATSGFEIKIPFTAVGLTAATAGTVQAFAAVVSSTGYYANVTVPGNAPSTCLGSDGAGNFNAAATCNFNTIVGGPWHTNAVVIPVELVAFNAAAQNNAVKLSWQTASEKNNNYFDVERSANGRDWSSIGTVKGGGTSSQRRIYDLMDDAPLSTVAYYRLKQVDLDGAFDYSPIVSVNLAKGGKQLAVFPNPTSDRLTLVSNSLTTEGSSVEIFDAAGRFVATQKANDATIDVSRLASGFYQLQVSDANGTAIQRARFIKN